MAELIFSQQQLTLQERQTFAAGYSAALPDAFTAYYLRVNGGVVAESDVDARRGGYRLMASILSNMVA